jgi:hypothetical protein
MTTGRGCDMRGKQRAYQLALSGKKTILRKKKPIVYFVRKEVKKEFIGSLTELCQNWMNEGNIMHVAKDVKRFEPHDVPLSGKNWYNADLYGGKAFDETEPSKEGNVVLGFCTISSLILDVDLQTKERVLKFADTYAEFQGLGSSLVTKTSDSTQKDLLGNRLSNWAIIFGKANMCWEEIAWHLGEARRLGMTKRVNAVFARFGYITERANAKNKDIAPPEIVKFFPHGDMRKIRDYVQFWNRYKNLGL